MSFPDLTGDVERATVVTVVGLDVDGTKREMTVVLSEARAGAARARPLGRPGVP